MGGAQIEIGFNTIMAFIALAISVFAYFRSSSWRQSDDTKELDQTIKSIATSIAAMQNQMENIEKAINIIPAMRERMAAGEQVDKAVEQRLRALECKTAAKKE